MNICGTSGYIKRRNVTIAGFTLIELSIVLVIIGLIVGSVFVGQTLIRQMQINSVMTDEQNYTSAALQFQQKYGMLPGDFAGATTFWGAMSTCPPSPGQASQGGTLTCNGNGNGKVDLDERFYFWQHLTNAQMIQGSYTGIPGSAGDADSVIGTNVPQSRISGAGFSIRFFLGYQTGSPYLFDGLYLHHLVVGSYDAGTISQNPALTASEAQAFDSKYDDGSPAIGNIRTFKNGGPIAPNCATTAVSATATYNVSYVGPACALILITGF